jgi:excisionase family DNA binding protein
MAGNKSRISRNKNRIMPSKKVMKAAHRRKPAPSKRDILNVHGIAALLAVSTDTVYELLQSGELPGRKVGREWRTTRNAVMRWLENTMTPGTAARRATQPNGQADGDAAALRAIEKGDNAALVKALQSGAVRIKAA